MHVKSGDEKDGIKFTTVKYACKIEKFNTLKGREN